MIHLCWPWPTAMRYTAVATANTAAPREGQDAGT